MTKQPTITTDNFTGPLDLLLQLLKKEKLTITEVSLVAITDQYLEYIERVSKINLPLIGEYYLLASTLMEMKTKALLPLTDSQTTEEEVDEESLVERLKEYEKYQKLAKKFQRLEMSAKNNYTMPPLSVPRLKPQLAFPAELSKQDLKKSYVYLLNKNKQVKNTTNIKNTWRYSIDTQTGLIRQKLQAADGFLFQSLITNADSQEIVTNFLAVLNMAKDGEVLLTQHSPNEVMIRRNSHGN